ncbi:ABC transporter permease [Arundinibacter roseus]|uniref:ABC transporter permease n=1 Tax=Arundinibacter roseus TaxID=2070510 RepID=A0A4R4KFP8_9BACT|nr:FtsX-like permease family protein [Arundinibacter roseus]TDB66790.1 ABC transporter permease [Arundinibacter roseus]
MASVNNRISRTYLTSSPGQTIVAILGVVFGISMYVFMTGFMTGVNNTQTELAFSALAHVHIYNDRPADRSNIIQAVYPDAVVNISHPKIIKYTDGIKNSAAITALLKSQPEITSYTTQVNFNVFFKNTGNKINGTISGVDVQNEDKVFNISKYMVKGNWIDLEKRSDGIILGSELASNLSVSIGDNLNILTADGVSKNYKVIGLFETGVAGTDKIKGYININAARQVQAANAAFVTDIQININDYNQTEGLVNKLAPMVPYKVESWQMANEQLVAGSELRDIIAIAVSLTILLVAGFGIYNIMNMTINQKIKEIAILKAMGFSGNDVTQIFLTEAVIIGIVGGVLGMGFGLLISWVVNRVPFKIANLETLPMTYDWQDYVLAFIFGLIITVIAGYLPALKASKIDPVDIIRG